MRVIIVGAGVSGLAAAHALRRRGAEVKVLEAETRAGGKLQSEHAEGYTVEWGPNGFLDNQPATLDLTRALGIEGALVRSSDAARRRFVVWNGELHALPESPGAFLRSRLLSPGGRLRVLCEPFPRRTPPDVEPSLAEFGRRRLGPQAVERLLDPMASGIYAGDPATLSVDAAFPKVMKLERQYGSLVRGMIATARERRRQGGQAASAGPGGTLHSFRGGIEELAIALRDALGDVVSTGARVTLIDPLPGPTPGGARVGLADGRSLEAERVVLAVPAPDAATLVRPLAPEAAEALAAIPYAPVAVVAFGYRRGSLPRALDGFGFLAPHAAGRRILGCLWDSSIFPGSRAPEGHALVRCLLGGMRRRELLALDDNALVDVVRAELGDLLGFGVAPDFVRVVRHERAIPQYTIGHRERIARAEAALAERLPAVVLAGNACRGVSLNDCVAEGGRIADRLLALAPVDNQRREMAPGGSKTRSSIV